MAKFEFGGLDEFQAELSNLARKAGRFKQEQEVPLEKLFPQKFMLDHTPFSSFDELLEAGNFFVESNEDFEAIPEAALDAHISSVTKFGSWKEMLELATAEYVEHELGF